MDLLTDLSIIVYIYIYIQILEMIDWLQQLRLADIKSINAKLFGLSCLFVFQSIVCIHDLALLLTLPTSVTPREGT